MSSHVPAAAPTRYTVGDASGTVSLFPSARFTMTTWRSKRMIVPRTSRPPACANAADASTMANSAVLMTFKKVLLISLLRSHGIQLLHFFELNRCDLRQMTDEVHELPVVLIVMPAAPRRHAAQPHTVSDDVEQFAVAEILRLRRAQVRNPWVKIR